MDIVMLAAIIVVTWKGSTCAPALNPNLAKNIWKAQLVEKTSTLNRGDKEIAFKFSSSPGGKIDTNQDHDAP